MARGGVRLRPHSTCCLPHAPKNKNKWIFCQPPSQNFGCHFSNAFYASYSWHAPLLRTVPALQLVVVPVLVTVAVLIVVAASPGCC